MLTMKDLAGRDPFLDPSPEEQPSFKFPDNSHYGRVLRKWNAPKRDGGMNANGFEKFPMMLHRAQEWKNSGKWICGLPEPEYDGFRNEADYMRELQRIDRFNRTCQRVVNDQAEYEQALASGEGWRETPKAAMEWRESLEQEVGRAANDRIASDRKMSPAAQREARKADAETADHLPSIPRTPVRKAGKRTAAA